MQKMQQPLGLPKGGIAPSSKTAPGPPVPFRGVSANPAVAKDAEHPSNPFQVDLVIPYDISLAAKGDRARAQTQVREGYERLLHALEGEGGLRVAARPGGAGKGQEEVWVFVGVSEEKLTELVEREALLDQSHNLPPHPHTNPPKHAARIRLLLSLLTAPEIQHGLGITPGVGQWKRVKSIAALHDEEADKAWLERWTLGGDWRIGLLKGLDGTADSGLGEHQPPAVHLYFEFLTAYTRSLIPLSLISTAFYFLTPADSYPPLYALSLCLYSTCFVAYWRVRERKLAVRWGTKGCESVAVSQLRPEYVAALAKDGRGFSAATKGEEPVSAIRAGSDLKRDVKVAASVPVVIACGIGLGTVLMGIFLLEAFVAQVYEGFGKEVVPLIPTVMFVLVVPQIVGLYQKLAKALVSWEDHPTHTGEEKSLTAKTFAANAIVAYLGLFLSAYVYVPFGPFIMSHVQQRLSAYQGEKVKIAQSAEKAGLGPRTTGTKQHEVKAGRLKGQLFAYTVTNQAVNTFLEIGLPFIMRFVGDWRAGKTTVKDAVKHARGEKTESHTAQSVDAEKRFLDKVERELALPEYNLFTDYAEIVTQFGYVTIWSIVWPLAPLSALVNNYFELRTDAVKICKHVRQPLGDRVECIGSWLHTLSIISWIGAVTSATLIYLFRPSTALHDQTPNPNVPTHGSAHLANIVASYGASPSMQTILGTLLPLGLVALTASHGYIVLRWLIDGVVERVFWRGSKEEIETQQLRARNTQTTRQQLQELSERKYDSSKLTGGFWNGGMDGAREIGRVGKAD